ncbi:MAG: 30S ribosomal protein S14 [Gammaproteobacteria bacterium WSBS_2016_MAG_OTU1]
MSKVSVVNRNIKRTLIVAKYTKKRAELKAMWLKPDASVKNKEAAFKMLQKLPRDSSQVRVRNRCAFTGRPRGVYRRFGISRTMLRDMVMNGEVPGVTKSSW